MGRMTAYDQNGRMVADFDKSEYDFLRRYSRTPEEVMAENAKLSTLLKHESEQTEQLRELVKDMRVCLEDECKRCHEWGDACELEQCVRELGVEVDA